MQPQGQTVEELAAFGGLGDELRTVLQVLFFLALGYIISRVCRSYRLSFAHKAALKTIKIVDGADEPCTEVDTVCEDMDIEQTCSKPSPRRCNAQVRKRMRKESQTTLETVEKVVLEAPACHSSKECLESPPIVEETTPLSQEVLPANQRVVKLMMKKAERKARKAAEEKVVGQPVQNESPTPLDNIEKSDSEAGQSPQVLLQVDQTTASQSLSSIPSLCGKSPSMLSSKSTLCESSTSLAGSTPDSARSESKDISECGTTEELSESCDLTGRELLHHADESHSPQESKGAIQDEVPGSIGGIGACSDLAHINFDDIESDTDSDVEFLAQAASVSTVDVLQSCPDMANAPVMWCNPGMMDESSPYPMQIEGWMPVAVPIECAPAGAFDGLWKNCADEKILIEKLEIMFESGVAWDMVMHSMTNMSVTLTDQTFYAELDGSGQQLLWSDGDVWTFHGHAHSNKEEVTAEVPRVMMQEMMMPILTEPEEMQMLPIDCFQQEDMMMHFPVSEEVQMLPNMQCMPANDELWETCWDWQNKGRCPRGSSCEWYHPEREQSFF